MALETMRPTMYGAFCRIFKVPESAFSLGLALLWRVLGASAPTVINVYSMSVHNCSNNGRVPSLSG